MSAEIIKQAEELAQPVCEKHGVELVDVEYVKEGQSWFLRVYVDTPEGIDIDQCADVAEDVSIKLDELDFIEDEYMLEVSSPGAERPLKTKEALQQEVANYINVKTYITIEGSKEFEGYLTAFENDTLTMELMIKTRKKVVQIPYDKVAKARLAIKF